MCVWVIETSSSYRHIWLLWRIARSRYIPIRYHRSRTRGPNSLEHLAGPIMETSFTWPILRQQPSPPIYWYPKSGALCHCGTNPMGLNKQRCWWFSVVETFRRITFKPLQKAIRETKADRAYQPIDNCACWSYRLESRIYEWIDRSHFSKVPTATCA